MGDYGSTDEKYLYVCFFNSCDCVSIYDEKGDYLFGWDEWDDKDFFTQLEKCIHGKSEEIEQVTQEEYMRLDLHGTDRKI